MPKEVCSKDGCNKRLLPTAFPCKCASKFCDQHRYPTDHACKFDFHENTKALLLKTMSTAVLGKKMEAI